MKGLSITSLVFFITSGILFVITIFVYSKVIKGKQDDCKTSRDKLNILDEIVLIHTDEKIEYQSQTTDMKSK